jgi:hypothetical protein
VTITNGYCTLDELKEALRITDTIDDRPLESSIEAASRRIDGMCSRRFYLDGTVSNRTYSPQRYSHVTVDDIGSSTGLVVKADWDGSGTFATTLTSGIDFQTEPLNALALSEPITGFQALDTSFPVSSRRRATIQVTAKWGWPSIPDAIREATVLLSARHFKRLDSPLGVAGFGDLGAIVVRRSDPDIEALVDPYRRIVVA